MKSLRILGPFPPPFGGVAIHCVRLIEALRQQGYKALGVSLGGVPSGLSDVSVFRPWHIFSRTPVHYHTDEGNFRWMLLLTRLWRLTGTKYIVTVHSFRHRAEFDQPDVISGLRKAFERSEAIIAISDLVADDIQRILGVVHKRLKVIPSNLPISLWEKQRPIPASISPTWNNSSIRILANAGAVTSYEGKDLYGIDVLLDAFREVSSEHAALCVIIAGVRDQVLMEQLQKKAISDTRVAFVTDYSDAMTPLVSHAHIVVRPTRTEGGPSLTVSEAMEAGRWTIASDAVTRPPGCITFQNENHRDLTRALENCIDNVEVGKMPQTFTPYSQALTQIVNLYQRLGFVSTTHTPADV